MKVFRHIAGLLTAINNCKRTGNTEWEQRHTDELQRIVKNHLPSGGGFDSGTEIDLARSKENRIVFSTAFHHMNETGYYNGWSSHRVVLKPDLAFEFTITVSGSNRGDIREYIADTFQTMLDTEIETAAEKVAAE